MLLAACESSGPAEKEDFDTGGSAGVFCLCEGNMNAGNASLSYYDPAARTVQNEVFYRANGAKLGDVAQSIFLREGRVFIPISNSGVIWPSTPTPSASRGSSKRRAASTPTRTTTSSRRATSTS